MIIHPPHIPTGTTVSHPDGTTCWLCKPEETADLVDLLVDDASTWPDGHPCRDCDRLAKDHSTYDSNCQGWR